MKQYKLTKERLEELKAELEHLKTVREHEVAELIKEARGFGDLSENSEYDEAKNEQGKLYSRIAELEAIIPNAIIIDELAASDKACPSVPSLPFCVWTTIPKWSLLWWALRKPTTRPSPCACPTSLPLVRPLWATMWTKWSLWKLPQ